MNDYVTEALQDATLPQLCSELEKRFPAGVLALVRPDPKNRENTMFSSLRFGSLTCQLGLVEGLKLEIMDAWANADEVDFTEGN